MALIRIDTAEQWHAVCAHYKRYEWCSEWAIGRLRHRFLEGQAYLALGDCQLLYSVEQCNLKHYNAPIVCYAEWQRRQSCTQ